MTLLLAGVGIWFALLTLFVCVLAAAGRADRAAEHAPARNPGRPRLRLLHGGAQDSSVSGNRTALAGRSSRNPL
jgi:hypothetical protein